MKEGNANQHTRKLSYEQKINFREHTTRPSGEEIYTKVEEENTDPRDTFEVKELNSAIEKSFYEDATGYDLEIPGLELGYEQKDVASKDEERNFYFLSGNEQNSHEED